MLEAGSAALAEAIDELARVHRLRVFPGRRASHRRELAPLELPEAAGFRADLRAWLESGQTQPHGCLGCAICLPVEPYNQFVTMVSPPETRTGAADGPTVPPAVTEHQCELPSLSRLGPFLSVSRMGAARCCVKPV